MVSTPAACALVLAAEELLVKPVKPGILPVRSR